MEGIKYEKKVGGVPQILYANSIFQMLWEIQDGGITYAIYHALLPIFGGFLK